MSDNDWMVLYQEATAQRDEALAQLADEKNRWSSYINELESSNEDLQQRLSTATYLGEEVTRLRQIDIERAEKAEALLTREKLDELIRSICLCDEDSKQVSPDCMKAKDGAGRLRDAVLREAGK